MLHEEMPDHQVEQELIEGLLKSLREVPHAAVHAEQPEASSSDKGVDARISFGAGGNEVALLVQAKRSVYPRDVREIVWQLRDYARRHPSISPSVVLMVAAQSLSPGAKDFLREEGVGYYDSGGSLFVPAPGAFVYVQKPPPKAERRAAHAIFSGKRSQVLHALLHKPHDWFGVHALATLARVSPATASDTLTELERLEWVATRGAGPSKERQLANPRPLLDAWARQVATARAPPLRRFYIPATDTPKLLARIGQACEAHHVDYVITQEAAAQHYAPFLTSVSRITCRLPPGRKTDRVIADLGARAVTEGANLIVIDTPGAAEFLFKERHADVWFASPLQVYLDLQQAGGRAKEQADHLRKERIGF